MPSEPKADYQGFVELLTRTEVSGWVVNSTFPQGRLEVELVSAGSVVGRARVCIEREDLASLNVGRTDFGFVLRVPNTARPVWEALEVRVVGTAYVLPFSQNAGALEGIIETVSSAFISGWAWQVGAPTKRLRLDVLHRGRLVAKANADLPRPDLLAAGIGDGRHGYQVDLARIGLLAPSDLENVEVKFEGSSVVLHDISKRAQLGIATLAGAEWAQTEVRLSPDVVDALLGSFSLVSEEEMGLGI